MMALENPDLRPARPRVRHGFFTRRGGASSGIYAGLNCGPGSNDQREAVAINRARVAEALGVPPDRLLSLHQSIRPRSSSPAPEGWDERPARRRGGHRPARASRSASSPPTARRSCSHDPEAGVIGAAHAGWRGALDGVLEATLDAMERLGARVPRDPRRGRADDQPARLRGRAGVPRPLPRRGGGLRALLRAGPRRPAALRPAGLRPRAGCASPASPRPPGSAPAPIPTRSASSPTAAAPRPASPTTGG